MKLKTAINKLKQYNKWRRWADIKQLDPKIIWIAIDTVIRWLKNNDELLQNSIEELQFEKLRNDYLLNVLWEIEVVTDDVLVKNIIKNSRERSVLDWLIHNRKLFDEINNDG